MIFGLRRLKGSLESVEDFVGSGDLVGSRLLGDKPRRARGTGGRKSLVVVPKEALREIVPAISVFLGTYLLLPLGGQDLVVADF